jgi:predicted ATPase
VEHNGTVILERPDEEDLNDDERLTQTHLEQIAANSQFREVVRFLDSVRYLHLVPQLLRNPEAMSAYATADDPYGRSFLDAVAKTPEKTRKSRLKRIESALRAVVPQLRNLTDTKDDSGVPHLEALFEHWRPNAGLQREDQFSDGTLRLIGLFWSLLEGDGPLLLEEPELSLNAEIVRRLPPLFHRLQKKRRRQILVSTHSSDILSDPGIGGEEIILLTPHRDGTVAKVASSISQVRELLEGGLSAADVVLPYANPPQLAAQLELFE